MLVNKQFVYSIELYCSVRTIFQRTALNSIELHCAALYFIELHCAALNSTVLYCTVLHYISVISPSITAPPTPELRIPFYVAVYSTVLYFNNSMPRHCGQMQLLIQMPGVRLEEKTETDFFPLS